MEKNELTIHFNQTEGIQQKWGWFLTLGILLMLLGAAMIGAAYTSTLFSVVFFGCFLVGASIVQIAHAILSHKWSGLFISLLLSILYGITGFLCITKPTIAAIDMTLLIAAFCFIGGLFRMITSLVMRFNAWGWVFFNGLITFILGILIYSEWPLSGLWLIGTFVGIDMLLAGWSWIILSLQAKRV